MDLADVLNDVNSLELCEITIKELIKHEDIPLNAKAWRERGSNFGLKIFDFFYMHEFRDDDENYGTMYFPTDYPDGDGDILYLKVEFFN